MTEPVTAPPPPVVIDLDVGTDHSVDVLPPADDPVEEEPDEEPADETPAPVVVVTPDPMAVVGDRLLAIEQRLDAVEQDGVSLRTEIANRADVTHTHPVPTELAALAEHLDAIDQEEVAPVRVRWWEKRLW